MRHEHDAVQTDIARPAPGGRSKGPSAEGGPVTLAARVASPASLLRLQRLAGNVAVQRAVAVDEVTTSVGANENAPGPAAAAPTTAGAGGGNTLGDGAGPVNINGPVVNLHAPMVQADGVVRASTIIADSVVASSYSPGAGNVW